MEEAKEKVCNKCGRDKTAQRVLSLPSRSLRQLLGRAAGQGLFPLQGLHASVCEESL